MSSDQPRLGWRRGDRDHAHAHEREPRHQVAAIVVGLWPNLRSRRQKVCRISGTFEVIVLRTAGGVQQAPADVRQDTTPEERRLKTDDATIALSVPVVPEDTVSAVAGGHPEKTDERRSREKKQRVVPVA